MLLAEWNERGNIVSNSDLTRLIERHLLESLAAVPLIDELGGLDLVDIGSGGGFPGIPIKIVRPDLRVVLLESRRMKSLFLQQAVNQLALEHAWVLQARAESASASTDQETPEPTVARSPAGAASRGLSDRPSPPRTFDLATARAVAAIPELTQWAAGLLKRGGHLITFKGSRLEEELASWSPQPGIWAAPRIVETPVPHLRLIAVRRL